jgi:hypothetical protein
MDRYFYIVYSIFSNSGYINMKTDNGNYIRMSDIIEVVKKQRGIQSDLPVLIISVTELTKEDFATWIS